MKLLITGARGMLGEAVVVEAIAREHEVWTSHFDVADQARYPRQFKPDAIINCAGVIPLKGKTSVELVCANSLASHMLAYYFHNAHIVQVSTDCVFGGKGQLPHATWELPNPNDLYGKSKLAGELLDHDNATTVRTSFIGPKHGLLRWLLDQPENAVVPGFARVTWSGSTHKEVARHLVRIAQERVPGLVHLSASVTTKLDLLVTLRNAFRPDIGINPVDFPVINRALEGTQFMMSVSECLEDLK